MDISKLDKNFDISFVKPNDLEWFSVNEQPFSIHGVFYSNEEGLFRRLPKEVADATSQTVSILATNTSGGRVRFITNSPYIAVHFEQPFTPPSPHMPILCKNGATLFVNKQFVATFMPTFDVIKQASIKENATVVFDGIKHLPTFENLYQVELVLPLYGAVNKLYIGLQKNCTLTAPKPYKHTKPVLFYGSSITQGGCASKPGDDYVNRLSRVLDTDILNLGFAGAAFAEKVIAHYIAEQKPSVFVLDYDNNAPNADYLQKTHFELYQTVRNANPTTPIVMATMPTIEGHEEIGEWRRGRKKVIYQTLEKAKSLGDKNFYLVDCHGCLGNAINGEYATVDDIHPDSLGFLRMTERFYPLLNELLNTKKE